MLQNTNSYDEVKKTVVVRAVTAKYLLAAKHIMLWCHRSVITAVVV